MSSLLYGCESWLDGNVKPMETLYNMCIKHLLGVRRTTNTNLCMIELGCPPLKALVKAKQSKFFKTMWKERRDMTDDPLNHMLHTVMNTNISTAKYIRSLLENENNYVNDAMESICQSIITSDSSKCLYYKTVNPNMQVHNIYNTRSVMNELEKISDQS